MARLTFFKFIRDQYTKVPPVVTADLKGKTVVVVGANTGLGFEASKHFARMNPARLILACRSEARGQAALAKLEKETGYHKAELWLVDLGQFSSVKAFADRFEADGGRLDVLVANAGISTFAYEATPDGNESTLQVNCVATSLLVLRLLPRMLDTAQKYSTTPRLVVVTSEMHMTTTMKQDILNREDIHSLLMSKEYCTDAAIMKDRYGLSKLLNVFFARALQDRLPESSPTIIVNSVNPGFCHSEVRRSIHKDGGSVLHMLLTLMEKILARTTEEGSRQLVYAAIAGEGDKEAETRLRGAYVSLAAVEEPSDIVLGEKGLWAQDKLWVDLIKHLSGIDSKVEDIVKRYLR